MKRSARIGDGRRRAGLVRAYRRCCRSASRMRRRTMQQRAETRLEEIIVTGSLITDPNRESPSPIVISTIESLQQSGASTLEAALNQMPQFAPSGSAGNGGQGTGGHATVNLHALGRESQSGAARWPATAAGGHLRHRRHQPRAGLDPVERADDHRRRFRRLRLGRDVRRRQLHLARSFRRRDLRCAVRQHRARRSVSRPRHRSHWARPSRMAAAMRCCRSVTPSAATCSARTGCRSSIC